jgi:hypothetical protein
MKKMTIDIDERKVRRNELGLWLGWTLATTGGMIAGYLLPALFYPGIDLGLARVVFPLLAGFFVGFFQWLVLKGYVSQASDWILSGGAGWAAGFALGLLAVEYLAGSFLTRLLGYLLFGIIIAVFQWPVLRREIPQALLWVVTSMIGWALGAFVSQWIAYPIVAEAGSATSAGQQVLASLLVNGITGLIAGAITGLAFVWIVRRPEHEDLIQGGQHVQ